MSLTCTPWVVAQPTGAEERARHPISDPALHEVLARSQAGRGRLQGIVLGERLARARGTGGRTVSHVWADAGIPVAVVPDPDPRTQSLRRQLLVDDRTAVREWGGRMRELGADLAWWSTAAGDPRPATTVQCLDALVAAGLRVMLRVELPAASVSDEYGARLLTDFLTALTHSGCDLSDAVLWVPAVPARSAPPGDLSPAGAERFVSALVSAIPEQVGAVVVTPDTGGIRVGGADAAALARSVAGAGAPWPVGFSAASLAFRRAAASWQVPELAAEAPERFDAVLDRLRRARREPLPGLALPGATPAAVAQTDARGRRTWFDSTLLRSRSLYSVRPTAQP